MGQVLDQLRNEYKQESANRKWWQRAPKVDAMLYLGARMRDTEDEKRDLEKQLVAMERAAIKIIGRYDADGSLYREWKALVDELRRHM
jgi:hypothetical protein